MAFVNYIKGEVVRDPQFSALADLFWEQLDRLAAGIVYR
jgi:hypothetical protein